MKRSLALIGILAISRLVRLRHAARRPPPSARLTSRQSLRPDGAPPAPQRILCALQRHDQVRRGKCRDPPSRITSAAPTDPSRHPERRSVHRGHGCKRPRQSDPGYGQGHGRLHRLRQRLSDLHQRRHQGPAGADRRARARRINWRTPSLRSRRIPSTSRTRHVPATT